ncbi:MAG: glutamate-cysteine ligase family protein [Gammaproteobacteria bacterium]|nr:MAG: glutamate-cysteine ligase family protein [Gammaproteobacteria bacterium]
MGQEIDTSHFKKQDFEAFSSRLEEETEYLSQLFHEHALSNSHEVAGFEVEAWLLDLQGHPCAVNETYLERLNSSLVVPELARFNVELNSSPLTLQGDVLSRMHQEFQHTWQRCLSTAADMQIRLMMIGILPTLRDSELNLENMSRMTRYRALNEQVLRHRRGRPLQFNITGREHLSVKHRDVMLESATTSYQLHLKVPLDKSVRYYNTSIALSAPMVAITANSPYLFGKDLWDETRIPLFEQAVEVGGADGAAFGPVRRVTFGNGYARDSMMECFTENIEHYPPLLPYESEGGIGQLNHLRLHNGTIWRWNRPLIGFSADGSLHLRIEHRVIPAGPSLIDAIANAALYFGLACHFASAPIPLESRISFSEAKQNFYEAARLGLSANIQWEGATRPITALLDELLLPAARQGLQQLGINPADSELYLGIIQERLANGQNGCAWQRRFIEIHGADMQAMTMAYLEHQDSGQPVHEWGV